MLRTTMLWTVTAVWIAAISASVPVPDCQSIAPTQNTLNVQTGILNVTGSPFGLAYAKNDIAFAALASIDSVSVLNTSTFTPTLIGEISLPAQFKGLGVFGLAITSDKQTVYASVGPGAIAINVEKAVAGEANSIVGILSGTVGTGAIEVTLSHDDKYAFVSQEYGTNATGFRGAIEVFNVQRTQNGSISSTYVGYITLGDEVVGTALSSDGSKLYATSETANGTSQQGTLSILDVATLETNPSEALLTSVDAGCGPVRTAVSRDGKYVWVTARESNKLLAFDTAKLESNSSDALMASVQVGTSPVAIALINHGRHIIIADSNRFSYTNTTTGLTVVDTEAALKGKQGFPRIPTGLFPRAFAVSPNNGETLLVSEFSSRAIQAVNLTQLS